MTDLLQQDGPGPAIADARRHCAEREPACQVDRG